MNVKFDVQIEKNIINHFFHAFSVTKSVTAFCFKVDIIEANIKRR